MCTIEKSFKVNGKLVYLNFLKTQRVIIRCRCVLLSRNAHLARKTMYHWTCGRPSSMASNNGGKWLYSLWEGVLNYIDSGSLCLCLLMAWYFSLLFSSWEEQLEHVEKETACVNKRHLVAEQTMHSVAINTQDGCTYCQRFMDSSVPINSDMVNYWPGASYLQIIIIF